MKIPQCAPGRFYGAHSAEMEEAIRKVFAGGWYILGNEVRAFEEEFAAWCGCAGAVGVANGTDALELALRALRLPEKSRVAVPALTASATGMAVLRAGLTPVLVDLDQYRTMSVVSLREAFRFFADIRAVVPVHLYGQMAALDEIIPAAAEYGAAVVEDCAQAHGAQLHGRRAGVFGVFGSFSFYPTKNLGAVGDGGLVTCADAACRSELEALRQYGWRERFDSSEFGLNSRLDELQAAILRVKLPHLDKDNEKRRFLAARYTAGLTGLPLELPGIVGTKEVAIAPIVSSARAAKLILRRWAKGFDRTADFVVIEGCKAGGHLGFAEEDLLADRCQTLDEILPGVLAEVKPYEEQYGHAIPVFVAGGVYTGADMAHFTKLGAAGVQLATRFIPTYECDASQTYKDVLLAAKPEDVRIIHSPVGMPGRALNTPLVQALAEGKRFPPKHCARCLKTCDPAAVPYCITHALIEAVKGNVEEGLFFCGENVGRLDRMRTVRELMDELVTEWRQNL